MMAFFMLMWLLNATTEQQRKGLADHFSPTIPINRMSGGGSGGGSGGDGDGLRREEVEALRGDDSRKAIPPLYGALLKNEQDVHLFEQLVFLDRRSGSSQ